MPTHLPDYVYHVSFRRYRPLNLSLSCEVDKGGFLGPICRVRVHPRFRTCIFKLHLLPSMWPVLVEFRLQRVPRIVGETVAYCLVLSVSAVRTTGEKSRLSEAENFETEHV